MAESLNILFTCVGRRVALLEQFRRAADALDMKVSIEATDIDAYAPAMQVADHGRVVPRCDAPDYLPTVLDIVARRKIGLLVPLTDLDLQLLADAQEQFAPLGCQVMIGSAESVAICRDKHRFSAAVEAAGLPTGRSEDLQTFRQDPFYPCFAKPLAGSASVGAALIRDGDALERHVARFGEDLVIQDVYGGQEYTIDMYRTRSGAFKAIVPRQRLVVRGGEVEQGLTVRDKALIDAARRLVSSLDGLWGAMCCQCRREVDGPAYFFELNPRFGGGAPLSIQAGADLPRYLLQDVLGRDVDGEVGRFTDGLLMMRYPAATITRVEDPGNLAGFDRTLFR